MGASNSTSKNIKFYSLKAKASAEETPHFALTEKVNEKWQVTNTFDTLSGSLVSAEIKEKEYQGAKFKVFILELQDETETSKLEMTHNSVTHNLINSLATECNKLYDYSFVVKKKQTKGNDGKMYWNGAAYVNANGSKEGLKWSVDPKSAPKKEPVMIPDGKGGHVQFQQQGKGVWDDSKLRAFWEEIFTTKIISALGGPVAKPQANTPSAPQSSSAHSNNQDSDIQGVGATDDLPF